MATGPVSMLSGDVLEKARKELNEQPEKREEAITELRRKIEEEEGKTNHNYESKNQFSSFQLQIILNLMELCSSAKIVLFYCVSCVLESLMCLVH